MRQAKVRQRLRVLCAIALALVGCGPAPRSTDAAADGGYLEPPPSSGEFEGLPSGLDQWSRLCAKRYGDAISAKFCAGTEPPVLTSIVELEHFLGFQRINQPTSQLTMTGLSTGVGLRTVTPLNPRAVVMTAPHLDPRPNDSYMVLTFARGEPLVELVANDPSANTLRFFVLRFHPTCESSAAGCNYADLLTPTIESGWTSYTLYDDDTVKNTTIDCLACHQPGGPRTRKILRMQELINDWTHWFEQGFGHDDFLAAHRGELYAGMVIVRNTGPFPVEIESPQNLELLLKNNGFAVQPNAFDSFKIRDELRKTGTSTTWQALYDRAVAGLEIPPPYYGENQTDPAKVASMVTAYQRVMNGTLARDLLPDIRDTLLDSALADMSIRPKPGLDGRGILVHICARCHNSRLDPTLSRARFNVDTLDTLSREEKNTAIARLQLGDDNPKKMPPVRFHTLSSAERDLVIAELAR